MKALLLRVGIDKGTDGVLAPIFSDGSFEFIPISENGHSIEKRTYQNTIGRKGRPFSDYLPVNIWNKVMHYDPEFETCTYGDPTIKRKYLLKLQKGDILVFYAGLTPYNNGIHPEALYIIGYFMIDKVIDFNHLNNKEKAECFHLYNNNAHMKRGQDTEDLVIVIGDKRKSKLLNRAILISEKKTDKAGKHYHAVSAKISDLLGISGSIQRSIPPRSIAAESNLDNLKNILGI